MSFAGLDQVLGSLFGHLPGLNPAQGHALKVALGLDDALAGIRSAMFPDACAR